MIIKLKLRGRLEFIPRMAYERIAAIVIVRGRPLERMLEGAISMQNHFFCDAKTRLVGQCLRSWVKSR